MARAVMQARNKRVWQRVFLNHGHNEMILSLPYGTIFPWLVLAYAPRHARDRNFLSDRKRKAPHIYNGHPAPVKVQVLASVVYPVLFLQPATSGSLLHPILSILFVQRFRIRSKLCYRDRFLCSSPLTLT